MSAKDLLDTIRVESPCYGAELRQGLRPRPGRQTAASSWRRWAGRGRTEVARFITTNGFLLAHLRPDCVNLCTQTDSNDSGGSHGRRKRDL